MKTNALWALIAGLAVGLLVGRELPRSGGGSSGEKGGTTETAVAVKPSGGSATAPKEIPADLLKLEQDMKASDKMAGLTVAQRYQVLKVMNDKPCDCGCPHGSTGKCLAEDPNCPRAPKILEQAIALAKQGKSADEITASVKKPEGAAPGNAPPAGTPQKVELAAWTPLKGAKNAKVTIVEFSDFQ